MSNRTGLEIAIIGMSCKFNGISNYQDFWSHIKQGEELIDFLSKEEMEKNNLPDKLINNENFVNVSAQIKDKNTFDISFFGISPKDALKMSPQSFLLLEAAWNTLEDAGYCREKIREKIGIYCGSNSAFVSELTTFLSSAIEDTDDMSSVFLSNKDYIPTNIAYKLNLTGPAISIDTACSSSLVAMHLACQGILNGDCSMALAGGVSVHPLNEYGYIYQENGIYSSDGHTRPFDNYATGTINAEGVGMVLLKSLEDAINDNDNIYGIIKGSAINNDGKEKVGYSAPSMKSQSRVIKEALRVSDISHEDISYIAAHGSGTIVGDPIEIQALKNVYGESDTKYCHIGSVKANLGHTIHASGVASLIKVICAMNDECIPPLINHSILNASINLENTPFSLATDGCIPWKNENDKSLYAGVSSFGIGGTNAHVILEKYEPDFKEINDGSYHIITLSAKTATALDTMENNLKKMVVSQDKITWSRIAYTLNIGKIHFPYRKFALVKDNDERNNIRFINNSVDLNKQNFKGNIFVFSGLGSQIEEIALDFYLNEKKFKDTFDLCCSSIAEHLDFDLLNYLKSNQLNSGVNKFEVEQLMIFSFEYSYCKLLMNLGIIPDKVLGYSFGEYTAACVSGIIGLSDAIKLIIERGKIIATTQCIVMVNIPMSGTRLKSVLENFSEVYITIDNADSCVVVGKEQEIKEVMQLLLKQRIICIPMSGTYGIHSHYMSRIAVPYKEMLERISFNSPQIPFISGTRGNLDLKDSQFNEEYWLKHLTQPVNFADCIKSLSKEKYQYTLMGYGSDLAPLLKRLCNDNADIIYFTKQNKDLSNPGIRAFYFQLASLWSRGNNLNWNLMYENKNVCKASLPTYPFEKIKVKENFNLFELSEYLKSGNAEQLQSLFQSGIDDGELGMKGSFGLSASGMSRIDRAVLSSEYMEPKDELQKSLAEIWGDLFGFSQIGINDDFIELGGDSLKSIKVTNIIADKLKKRISPKWFFKNRTIAGLAEFIIENGEKNEYDIIPKAVRKSSYEMLPTQNILYQICKENDYNNFIVSKLWTIKGHLNIEEFQVALNKVIQMFSLLRTSFVHDGKKVVAKINDFNEKYSIPIYLNSELTSVIGEAKKKLSDKLRNGQYPLFDVNIFENDKNEYTISFLYYSFLMDGFSTINLIEIIMQTYKHGAIVEPEIQFIDYAEYINTRQDALMYKASKKFWESKIGDSSGYSDRNSIYKPQEIIFDLDADYKENLLKSAFANKTTINSILIIAYNMALCEFLDKKILKLGMITSHKELQTPPDTIGFYSRIIPLSIETDKLLDKMLFKFNEFQEHTNYPFERIYSFPYHELRNFYKYLIQFHDVHDKEKIELEDTNEKELLVLDQRNEWNYFPCDIKMDVFNSEKGLSFCLTTDKEHINEVDSGMLKDIFLNKVLDLIEIDH